MARFVSTWVSAPVHARRLAGAALGLAWIGGLGSAVVTAQDPDRFIGPPRPPEASSGWPAPRAPTPRRLQGPEPARRQVPAPPRPPAGAPPLPPVSDPEAGEPLRVLEVPRDDLQRPLGSRSPLEGIWRLERLVDAAGVEIAGEGLAGWLAIGRGHLMVQLRIHRPGSDEPALLQASTYAWTEREGELVLTALLGHRGNGSHLVPDRRGEVARRRVVRSGGRLRLGRSATEWMEFVRIE